MMFLHSKPKSECVFKKKIAKSKVDVEALEFYFTLTMANMQLINDKVS